MYPKASHQNVTNFCGSAQSMASCSVMSMSAASQTGLTSEVDDYCFASPRDPLFELRQIARNDLGPEQLHLSARQEEGLESFYSRLGWREIGRWPGALRLAPEDTWDEVLMLLNPL